MGTGLRAAFNVHGISYTHFIFPGIIVMNLIFAAMQSTISIIWDRELSGAIFPIDNLPFLINVAVRLNPLTYGVDFLRRILLGIKTFPLHIDFLYLATFAFVMLSIGVFELNRRT